MFKKIQKEFRKLADGELAVAKVVFFNPKDKTYGAHDQFLGITVPATRTFAKKIYDTADLEIVQKFLESPYNEERTLALMLLIRMFEKGDAKQKNQVVKFYLDHTHYVNNWNLVDLSAYKILGAHCLENENTAILYKFVKSKNLWERRIAIVATYIFIKKGELQHTLDLSVLLINDKEDLMHKAVGWMLREVGKQNEATLKTFLSQYGPKLPRTALRYAIERFTVDERKAYLSI